MNTKRLFLITLVCALLAILTLIACSPKVQPTATPTYSPVSAPTPSIPKATPAISPEALAWQKIVEAARAEGKVTAYSYNFLGDVGISIQRAFESRYGIKLDIITGLGAQFLERIKTEKRMGQMSGDFTEGSVVNLFNMKKDGLLVSVYQDIPVVREEGVWVADPTSQDSRDKEILPFFIFDNNPYINTNLVKPGEEPKSFYDLLDPKWKGKLGIPDPAIVPSAYELIVPMLEQKILDEEYFRGLGKQNLLFYKALPDALSALSRGEYSLLIRSSDSTAASFAKEGAPIKAIAMKEGTISSGGGISAIKGGPHPNATKVFVNWAISKEGQTVYTGAKGNASVRKDVPDTRPVAVRAVASRQIVSTPEHLIKAAELMRERWLFKLWGR